MIPDDQINIGAGPFELSFKDHPYQCDILSHWQENALVRTIEAPLLLLRDCARLQRAGLLT